MQSVETIAKVIGSLLFLNSFPTTIYLIVIMFNIHVIAPPFTALLHDRNGVCSIQNEVVRIQRPFCPIANCSNVMRLLESGFFFAS